MPRSTTREFDGVFARWTEFETRRADRGQLSGGYDDTFRRGVREGLAHLHLDAGDDAGLADPCLCRPLCLGYDVWDNLDGAKVVESPAVDALAGAKQGTHSFAFDF
jgi:hypothetical protein